MNLKSLVLVSFFIALSSWGAGTDHHVLPNPETTPGLVNPSVTQANVKRTICVSGWTKTIRPPASYTTKLKLQQLVRYGYHDRNPRHFEEDHLISLELGGHPTDPRNLWPEPYAGTWGAKLKDKVETRLKVLVCSGKLSLTQAQKAISTDWTQAYRRYVAPSSPAQ